MLKIRRSRYRLIFNTEIPIPGKNVFMLRRDPDPAMQRENKHKIYNEIKVVDMTNTQLRYSETQSH